MKDLIRRILREQIMINEFARGSKSNTDEFIEKAKKVHGNKYTYDNVDYKRSKEDVIITCPKPGHGDFPLSPQEHLSGKGCRNCYLETLFSNTDEFIEKAKKVHGNKYTYDNVDYKGSKEDVIITCPKPGHGDFLLKPWVHLQGRGCRNCYLETLFSNTDEFIEKAKKVHGDKYTYDNVDYKGSKEDVIITCPKPGHGDFLLKPSDHLQGRGCKNCWIENRWSNTDEFIEKAKKVHGDKYTYDNVDYKRSKEDVIITCKTHGDFPQPPSSHLLGSGCPTCSESKGELMVAKILNTLEIQFVKEKKFEDCKNSKVGRYCRRLPFDFYLPEFNVVIEYDGRQHFEPIKFYGGEERFKTQKIYDEIKNKYCKDNGIKIIRIPYTIKFDDILSLLKNELGITG